MGPSPGGREMGGVALRIVVFSGLEVGGLSFRFCVMMWAAGRVT